MPNARLLPRAAAATIAVGLALVASQAPAVQCQGLQQNACAAKPGCQWVDPYERKDGVKVMGYCRGDSPERKPGDKSGATPLPVDSPTGR